MCNDGLVIKLADGTNSNAVKVEVYSTHKPMMAPLKQTSTPLVIFKEIGKLVVFVDFSHPLFTRCGLSKEQLISSEIAMYLYDERRNLSNLREHSLSNLTWEVLRTNWHDTVEISVDSVLRDSEELLNELRSKLMDIMAGESAIYFDDLTLDQKKQLTNNLLQHGIDLSKIGDLKDNGEYLLYAPYSFLITLYKENPDMFFGGGVWTTSLASGGEDLLGHDVVAQAREKIVRQYENNLIDVVTFAENKYSDILTLQRVKLSIEFLRKGMV